MHRRSLGFLTNSFRLKRLCLDLNTEMGISVVDWDVYIMWDMYRDTKFKDTRYNNV